MLITNPREYHDFLIKLVTASKKSFVAMGQMLYELHRENTFKKVVGDGVDTWRQYLAQPEIGLTLGEANRLIQIYEEFVLRLGFSPEVISDVPVKNLHYLLPMIKDETDNEKVGEWLADATLLSQSDFRQRIGELKSEKCTYEYMVMKRCQENNRLSKIPQISHEMILEAFKKEINEEDTKTH